MISSGFADELTKIAAISAGLIGAGLGAGIGGATGAATARPGEARWKAGLRGAGLGAIAGGLGGRAVGAVPKQIAGLRVRVPGKFSIRGLTPEQAIKKGVSPEEITELLKSQKGVEIGKIIGKGAGAAALGTAGAAGAGVLGSRVIPATSGYLQQRAPYPGGY
jgi:hypothetical protein